MHDQRENALVALAPAERVTANNNSTGIDISQYIGTLKIKLDAQNQAGTNPTLDVKIQESDTIDGTYTDVTDGEFTQVTDAAVADEDIILDTRALKKFIRTDDVIGGTDTPSFDRAVTLVGRKQVGNS